MQPLQRDTWMGETMEEWHGRRIASGMRCMRLPAHYEVVDAELAGIMMALRETAGKTESKERRVLIMSDCVGAIQLVERAWRAPNRRTYATKARGAMLEAINTYREKLESPHGTSSFMRECRP